MDRAAVGAPLRALGGACYRGSRPVGLAEWVPARWECVLVLLPCPGGRGAVCVIVCYYLLDVQGEEGACAGALLTVLLLGAGPGEG